MLLFVLVGHLEIWIFGAMGVPSPAPRATIKAHPAAPRPARPYGRNDEPIRIWVFIGYSGFSTIVVWVFVLMYSLYRKGVLYRKKKGILYLPPAAANIK
jgi:hypothetical protein